MWPSSTTGAPDVTGTANAAATVSVNGEPTARRGDYFYKELAVNNGAGPVYAQVNVVGARNNFGAGGTGGPLPVRQGGGTYQVGYDASGNVTALVDAATGKAAASYDYDPFGNTIKAVGDFASSNPFRFGTKYAEAETGLVYYGERYYQPQTGRRLSRDPLGEEGGVNLYGFVGNNPVSMIDPTGLYEEDVHYYLTYYVARRSGCFSEEEAQRVAERDQQSDEDPKYAPAPGVRHTHIIRPDEIGEEQRRKHEKYHALTDPRNHERNLAELMAEAGSTAGAASRGSRRT